jgi:hypothetical protein
MSQPAGHTTHLTFAEDTLQLSQGSTTIIAQLNPERITRQYFRHSPPTPTELEYAIQDVEDSLHPAYGHIGGGSLGTPVDALHGLTAFLALPAGTEAFPRDNIEAGFSRLAALSEGRPLSLDPLPPDAHFAATLLIIRELMHHLDFSDLRLEKQ